MNIFLKKFIFQIKSVPKSVRIYRMHGRVVSGGFRTVFYGRDKPPGKVELMYRLQNANKRNGFGFRVFNSQLTIGSNEIKNNYLSHGG